MQFVGSVANVANELLVFQCSLFCKYFATKIKNFDAAVKAMFIRRFIYNNTL